MWEVISEPTFFDLTIILILMLAAHFIAKKESALAGAKQGKELIVSLVRE